MSTTHEGSRPIRFAAVGFDHAHAFGTVAGLLNQGCQLVGDSAGRHLRKPGGTAPTATSCPNGVATGPAKVAARPSGTASIKSTCFST